MPPTMAQGFDQRVRELPVLGVGISTEFGAGREGLDLIALKQAHENSSRGSNGFPT